MSVDLRICWLLLQFGKNTSLYKKCGTEYDIKLDLTLKLLFNRPGGVWSITSLLLLSGPVLIGQVVWFLSFKDISTFVCY